MIVYTDRSERANRIATGASIEDEKQLHMYLEKKAVVSNRQLAASKLVLKETSEEYIVHIL